MALSLKHMDDGGGEIQWQAAKDPNADPEAQEPNDAPPWTVLTDSDHGDDWFLASAPVQEGVPPDRPTMAEAARTTGSMADFYRAFSIAIYAVKATRYLLTRGALNAVFPLEPELNPDNAPANYRDPNRPPRYVCGNLSPKYLYDISEGLFQDLYKEKIYAGGMVRALANQLPRDPLVGIMSRYYGTMTIGGGVCSMVSSVVAGMATLSAFPVRYTPDNNDFTEILVCLHSADHSFCVIGYRESPWIVADPWVGEPFILPWEENYFDQAGVENYQRIIVRHRLRIPWGVEILEAAYNRQALTTTQVIQNFPLTRALIEQAENSVGARNAPTDDVKADPPHMVWAENQWVKNENIAIAGGRNFHTDKVWQHLSNHQSYNADSLADYRNFRAHNRPVTKANQWGRDAGIRFDLD